MLLVLLSACGGTEDGNSPEGLAQGGSSVVTGGAGATAGGACNGLAACGSACVDANSNPAHCGMCGHACSAGERCQAGQCLSATDGAPMEGASGASGVGTNDGCSDTPVAGLSLSEIAVYQSVKIPIMMGMAAVEPALRNADVVQERDAVFRIHVTPDTGWTPRLVSARVDLISAGGPRRFFMQLSPTGPSTDENPANAFHVKVPAAAIGADTMYSVSLVECGVAPATAARGAARFPKSGSAQLGARKTGPLRVRIIPLVIGGSMPDVSAAAIDTYRQRLMAIYPVTRVELDVGTPLASSAASMCAHLTAIGARRSADSPPADMYYYGLTNGTSGGQSGCSNVASSASTRSSKTAAGWASSNGRIESGAATMCHELGHAHGRLHAPCQVQDPDPNYPYPMANTGVWGYDARSDTYLPPTRKDMMSYCPNPDRTQAWISDYTYKAILARVEAVNALTSAFIFAAPGPKESWQTLVVDSAGKHWGEYPLLLDGPPDGTPLRAIIHRRSGSTQTIEVYKEELEDGISESPYRLTMPQPSADWHAIEVPGLLPLELVRR